MAATLRRRCLTCFVALLLLVVAAAGTLYYFASRIPDFYAQALSAMSPEEADVAGDEFEAEAIRLAGAVGDEGTWNAKFTERQINGWLTIDLLEKHGHLLPPGFADPRIKLFEDRAQIGVRYDAAGGSTIAWLDVEVRLTDAHEAAIIILDVRAGSVPLPPGQIVDAVGKLAERLETPIHWKTVDDDPAALISLPTPTKKGLRYELEKLKISDGMLFLSGRTHRVEGAAHVALGPKTER